MTVPILVEPVAGGFRASTGGPLALSADGPTAADAVAALRGLVAARSEGRDQVAVGPPFAAPIGDDPWFAEFLAACAENRAQVDAPLDQAG